MVKQKAIVVVTIFLVVLSSNLLAQGERVFFSGFEKEGLLKWLKMWKDEGDTCHIVCPTERARHNWTIRKGEATEGDWAFIMSIGKDKLISEADLGTIGDGYKLLGVTGDAASAKRRNMSDFDFSPGRTINHLSGEEARQAIESGWSRCRGAFEGGEHWHYAAFFTADTRKELTYPEEVFPRDWRGYGYLRMDIKSQEAEFMMRMAFEDDKVSPPIEERFIVPPGKWVTLEMDLNKFVKERKVDLSKICTFWVFWEGSTAPTMVYVDNIRLSPKGVEAKLPVIYGGPKLPRPIPRMPQIEVVNPKRNLTPIALSEPIIIADLQGDGQWGGQSRIFAYDNNRLVLYNGSNLRYTIDGGKIWGELAGQGGGGSVWMNPWFSSYGAGSGVSKLVHMTAKGDILAFGGFGDCLYHCAPSVDSQYFRKLIFKGDSWTGSPMYIAAGETRACTVSRVISSKSGKYWCAVFVMGRRVPPKNERLEHIHAWYSDDGGMSWQAPGKEGFLSDSRIGDVEDTADAILGHPGARHGFITFFLIPYKNEVACIWKKTWRSKDILFSFFDGNKWAKPQLIKTTSIKADSTYSAVSLGEEIFISTSEGISRWDGSKWLDDLSGPRNAILAVCGDKQLLGFTVEEDDNKVANRILCWRRSLEGRWQHQELVKEEGAIAQRNTWSGKGWAKLLMNTMPNSPPNFAPLVWSIQGQKGVKLLKVPAK